MATTTGTGRTTHLLALMKKGDDAFNDRDFAVLNAIHHPDMVAYVTGNAEPIYGSAAHAAMVQQMFRIFPDVHVHNDPYPVQFGSGDWITVVTRTTGTFTGEMVLPDGTVVPPTGKAFALDFGQTSKWQGDQLIAISAFWDSALQARQIGLGLPRRSQPARGDPAREPAGGHRPHGRAPEQDARCCRGRLFPAPPQRKA
jgi:hypothetical protein